MTARIEMTPRERVMTALNLQEPDRVPVDLAQAGGDGITAVAYQHLVSHLGLPARAGRIMNMMAQSVHVDEDVLQRFRVDFRRVDMGGPDNWKNQPVGEDGYRDEWGVVRSRPEGSYYYDLTESPMTEDTMAAIDRFPWPDADDPGRYRGLRERARELHEETDYAVVLNLNSAFFLRCAELRGWENFYMDMAGNPKFAFALMERYLDVRLHMAELALEGNTVKLDLPVRVPELTLRFSGADIRGISADGEPLTRALTRAAFRNNTFYRENDATFAAFDPRNRSATVEVHV